jgi:NAD(P)-dependent dehydrogenase (short-subunit alcohol dehydrogenase family)
MTARPDASAAAATLEGRRVLVVGASAGVGRAFAELAIGQGAHVVVSARRAERLDEVVAAAGGGTPAPGDVAVDDDRRRIVDRAVTELGEIDLLFYAVGLSPLRLLRETDPDTWRSLFETNVIGLQRMLAGLIPHMSDRGVAAVLASEIVGRPRHGLGAYGSSKAAVSESLRTWRLEHPEVRFSCVYLGATQPTEFGDDFDLDVVVPLLEVWTRHGVMQRDFMETGEVASVLAGVLASALRHPGIGIEDLTLRSPSPVGQMGSARPS